MSLRRFVNKILGDPDERLLKTMRPLVDRINSLESEYEMLSDVELGTKTPEFLRRLESGETLDDILPEAFAAVRAASKRMTGMRHYDVQLLGGIALHRGFAVEMKTGEGKTLVATLPLYLNALSGKGTHLVTVNDYLARRDVRWMGPIYNMLGLSVGLLQQGDQKAFIFDPDYKRPGDDYDLLSPADRKQAYRAHITYGTNSEFGFDYLRDNSTYSLGARVQRGFYYAIIDEVDNILIDEARTPLIISGPASEPTDEYYLLAKIVRQLSPEDYEIDEKARGITLTDAGYDRVEKLLGIALFDPKYPEEMTPQQMKLHHHLEQALKAEYIFQRDHDYIVQNRRVVIVDEFTGRTMPGRRWSDGLHQAVEAKEGVEVRQENVTYATITLQNYFRMYDKLAGMTGTAATEAEEFQKIYNLDVLVLPTNRPVVREDMDDVILRTQEAKFRSIAQEIVSMHCLGRPVLVGTASVENSEYLSARLESPMLRKLASVALLRDRLNARGVDNATYKEGMHVLSQPLESLSLSQLRKLADQVGVGINIKDASVLAQVASLFGVDDPTRLASVLDHGVPFYVLNARQHTQEAKIVAGAGQVGAVTIATNMAGRGVDIKLGGELAEETLSQVNRVLRQNGHPSFALSFDEKAEILQKLDPQDYYLYQDAVQTFLKHVQGEKEVKALGGLHVLGTERHEARRIDNQLRGRSGRQGDPGSSCFYLSLEDDLMRRFGGTRVTDLTARLGIEDDMPIAMGIVSKVVANAQSRVEGYNFDIRKHLIEYDDVLNTQREIIYEQRKKVLSKPDLRDDVWAMVEAEIRQHIDTAWTELDAEGKPDTFRVISYLERIQPATRVADQDLFPSFTLKQVFSSLPETAEPQEMREALGILVNQALASEREYVRSMAELTVQRGLEQGQAAIERVLDAASIAYEGIESEFDENERVLDAQSAVRAVSQQTALNLDANPLHGLEGRQLERALMDQVRILAQAQVRMRLLAQVAQRVRIAEFDIDPRLLTQATDQDLVFAVMDMLDKLLTDSVERLASEIEHDIQAQIRRPADCAQAGLINLIHELCFGARSGFDKQHRRVSTRTERFRFTAWVAEQVAEWDRDHLEQAILQHLQDAINAWADAWGRLEFQRISARSLAELDQETRRRLEILWGQERFSELVDLRVSELSPQDAQVVRDYLGERVLFNVQRQLMLEITGSLWVEYLTSIDLLRQGIGLQSYAQKDPLAEYKVRAYEMFQSLMQSIQSQIVTAMFVYRPRDLVQVRVGVDRKKVKPSSAPAQGTIKQPKSRKRRKRR
ncbi:MAG: hypothetical protein JXA89_17280 [Anaerolineae bacterium]|nr:hypothetical protein [Anaerolineae bacterium]